VAVLLGVAIAGQVAWGEVKLLREVSAPTQSARLSAGLRTPLSEFVRAHVPAGRTIVYVTEGHGIPELFSYYELSYAMTPSNRVWWAADGTVTTVVDWWLDASGGSASLVRVARAKGSAYLVFAGRPPPPDLPVIGLWREDPADAVVQIRT
jgi:hypothetical protein